MNKLLELRKEIDDLDLKIEELFYKRMAIVKEVKKYKQESNISVEDNSREKIMFERVKMNNEFSPYYLKLLEKIIQLSKEYQNENK